ncbi:MAG TPA: hypothetical protein VK308_02425 [Pyrinomonadaceae bacterium]|nr:hypothetical protein [Pyrinomonadaceae bacterium]
MTARKTPSAGTSVAGANSSNGKGGISWKTSPRVVIPKRTDFKLNLDVAVTNELDKFENYLQESLSQNEPLKNGIVEEVLLKYFKEDLSYQNWLKDRAKKAEEAEKDRNSLKLDADENDILETNKPNQNKTGSGAASAA